MLSLYVKILNTQFICTHLLKKWEINIYEISFLLCIWKCQYYGKYAKTKVVPVLLFKCLNIFFIRVKYILYLQRHSFLFMSSVLISVSALTSTSDIIQFFPFCVFMHSSLVSGVINRRLFGWQCKTLPGAAIHQSHHEPRSQITWKDWHLPLCRDDERENREIGKGQRKGKRGRARKESTEHDGEREKETVGISWKSWNQFAWQAKADLVHRLPSNGQTEEEVF